VKRSSRLNELRCQGEGSSGGRVGTEQVVSKASCTAQQSSLSYTRPHCWSLAKLKMDVGVTTSGTPVGIMLELLRSAIVAAKKRARTTRAPGKLTVQRFAFTGAPAAFCLMSVTACFLLFCLVPACVTAADFFAFGSALFAPSFASPFAFAAFAFAFAAFAFAALITNSFAVSSASKDSWRKFFGMRTEMPKPSA